MATKYYKMDKESESYALSGTDMQRLIGGGVPIMEYPEISDYDSIEELFREWPNGVLLLYLQQKDQGGSSGHWSALTPVYDKSGLQAHGNGGLIGAEFFCSYGMLMDGALNWLDKSTNDSLGQDHNYLSRLLLAFKDRGGRVLFNECKFQKRDPNVATCGRYAGLRLRFNEIPLKEFQRILKRYKRRGWDTDELVTEATNKILNF